MKPSDMIELQSFIESTKHEMSKKEYDARYKDIKKLAKNYGLEHQKMKLAEECGELIQTIIKNILEEPTNFAEEFADVKLLMMQIEYLEGKKFNNFVDSMISKKIERQLLRIKGEK